MNFFLKVVAHVFCLIPRQIWRYSIGGLVGFLWYDLFRIRRKDMYEHIKIAFPEATDTEVKSIARKSIYKMSMNFAEMFRLPAITKSWIEKNIVFEGWEHVEKARQKNKGIYFLALHMGSGDMSATSIVAKGLPLYLITKRFKIKWLDQIWFAVRGSGGVGYINAHGSKTSFEILKAIKEKASVVFVIDQFMGPPYGIETTFFGKKTGTAYGLALFHLKTKTPVIPVYSYEGPESKIHVCFDSEVETESKITEDHQKSIQILTQMFNDKLEGIIKKHPDEWLWLHRRWKEYRIG